jgi:hypothetical protein
MTAKNFSAKVEVDGEVAEGQVAAITIANAAPPFSVLAHGHTGECIYDGACWSVRACVRACVCVRASCASTKQGSAAAAQGALSGACTTQLVRWLVRVDSCRLHRACTCACTRDATADGKLEAIGYVAEEGFVASPVLNVVNMVRVAGVWCAAPHCGAQPAP